MTPEDIQWPPPLCKACRHDFCDHCDPVTDLGCDHECPWIYPEEPDEHS